MFGTLNKSATGGGDAKRTGPEVRHEQINLTALIVRTVNTRKYFRSENNVYSTNIYFRRFIPLLVPYLWCGTLIATSGRENLAKIMEGEQ